MHGTWIVVADSAHARVLEQESAQALREVHALAHPASRLHEGDLRTGGKGAIMDSAGHGHRQPDPATTTAEKHANAFAEEIAHYLSKFRHKGRFDRVVLVAEPALLGSLRKHLDSPTAQTVVQTIDKNWVSASTDQILKRLKGRSQ